MSEASYSDKKINAERILQALEIFDLQSQIFLRELEINRIYKGAEFMVPSVLALDLQHHNLTESLHKLQQNKS